MHVSAFLVVRTVIPLLYAHQLIIRGPLLYAVFKQEFGTPKYLNYSVILIIPLFYADLYYTRFLA